MNLKNIYLLFIAASLAITSCKKDDFQSRDTSNLVPEEEEPEVEVPDPTLVVFDNAENVEGWDGAGGAQLNDDKKQGEHSIKATITEGNALRMQKGLSVPIDTKLTKENARLVFWLYVEDPARLKLSDGQIEVTSSGGPDNKEYNWPSSVLERLQPGWNKIELDLKDAGESEGGADLSAINFFRFYMNTQADASVSSPFTVALDGIVFVKSPNEGSDPGDNEEEEPQEQKIISFINCDVFNEDLWEISGGTGKLDTKNKKEGTGALFGRTHPDNGYLHFKFKKGLEPAINTGLTEQTAQLSFWIYISEQVPLKGQIEISSSGRPDAQEYAWDVSTLPPLKVGAWNELKLNIRDANISEGPVDLNSINFFRMFIEQTGKNDVEIGIDDIKFVEIPAADSQ